MELQSDQERILTSTPKRHASPTERKTLQTLQLSATGNKLNGGKEWTLQSECSCESKHKETHHDEPSFRSENSSPQTIKIYEDSYLSVESPIAYCSQLTQTDDSLLSDLLQEKLQHVIDEDDNESGYIGQKAHDLMGKEEVSETYWKDTAEQRRLALKDTLAVNEQLHTKLEFLIAENRRLKMDIIQLQDVAAKAEAIAAMLADVLSEDDDDDDTGFCERDSETGSVGGSSSHVLEQEPS